MTGNFFESLLHAFRNAIANGSGNAAIRHSDIEAQLDRIESELLSQPDDVLPKVQADVESSCPK